MVWEMGGERAQKKDDGESARERHEGECQDHKDPDARASFIHGYTDHLHGTRGIPPLDCGS